MQSWLIGAVAVLACTAIVFAIHIVKKLIESGMLLSQRSGGQPVFRRCKDCEGCGVVMIDGKPIPKSVRSVQQTPDGMIWPGSIANTKKCMECGGMGSYWTEPSTDKPRPNALETSWLEQHLGE